MNPICHELQQFVSASEDLLGKLEGLSKTEVGILQFYILAIAVKIPTDKQSAVFLTPN